MDVEFEGLTIRIQDEDAAVSVKSNTANTYNPYAQETTIVSIRIDGLTVEVPVSVACELVIGLAEAVGFKVIEPEE